MRDRWFHRAAIALVGIVLAAGLLLAGSSTGPVQRLLDMTDVRGAGRAALDSHEALLDGLGRAWNEAKSGLGKRGDPPETQAPAVVARVDDALRALRRGVEADHAEMRAESRRFRALVPLLAGLLGLLAAAALVLVVTAVAQRRRAESRAARDARHLTAFLENVPAAVQVKDLQGRYLLASRFFRVLHGRTDGQIVGLTPYDLLPREVADAMLANDRVALDAGRAVELEETVRLNGRERAFEVTKFPLRDSRGGPYAVCGIALEVTERRLAEEAVRTSEARLRALFDGAPVAISILRQGVYLYVNPAFAELFGLPSPAEAVGRSPLDVVTPEARPAVAQRLAGFARGEPNRPGFETMGSRPDGTVFPVHVTSRQIESPDGPAIIAFFTDMTEQRRAEDEIRGFAMRLERSNRDLQDFAYVASHDLKEPLRKIRAFGDRIEARLGDALDPDSRHDLDRMLDAAARMQELIVSLLSVARVSTSAEALEPVDLGEVVRTVLSDLEPAVEAAKATVEVGPLPRVEADPIQMRQLMQNLLSNALKFRSPERPACIRVGCAPGRDPGRDGHATGGTARLWHEIRVEDNGIGFDEEHAERIFGVFQRLHGRAEYEGTGVGLAVCRRICERHGGAVVARGTSGVGAAFLVTLPGLPEGGEDR